jgi:hypothetical protein
MVLNSHLEVSRYLHSTCTSVRSGGSWQEAVRENPYQGSLVRKRLVWDIAEQIEKWDWLTGSNA